jgi:pimeloyl-ACP methyl ester carboxylesterase
MEQGIIELRSDLQIFYRDVGEGDETVIIPLACWTENFDRLATGRRLIYYDPRGRGRSSAIAVDDASFDADLADLEAVQRNACNGRASFIGWSYFGGVVARYAMLHPERVRRVITIGGMPIRKRPWMEIVDKQAAERASRLDGSLLERMRRGPGPQQFDAFWEVFQATRLGRSPAKALPGHLRSVANEWPESFFPRVARAIESMGDWDWREDARRLDAPMLVIEGGADYAPEAGREWTEYAPDARVVMLEGVGHAPPLEDPERFFTIVDRFLGGEWPAEAEAARA